MVKTPLLTFCQFVSATLFMRVERAVSSGIDALTDSAVVTEIRDSVEQFLNTFHAEILETQQLVEEFVLLHIQNSIDHGRTVIVVSHSQGNLYANRMFSALSSTERQYVRLYSVATPADYVGTSGTLTPYVTRDDDFVINLLRLLSSALPGNYKIAEDSSDWLNHGFIEAYLSDAGISNQMVQEIAELAEELSSVSLDPIAGTGIITVTLTWGSNPDVDLHVIEPEGGAHVCYWNEVGTHGTLDVDDTSSYGPENYIVPCDQIVSGKFRVYVDYYSGFYPETATVVINACGSIRTFQRNLASDDEPYYAVADIDVTTEPRLLCVVTETMGTFVNIESF
jgi:hypothetical protein